MNKVHREIGRQSKEEWRRGEGKIEVWRERIFWNELHTLRTRIKTFKKKGKLGHSPLFLASTIIEGWLDKYPKLLLILLKWSLMLTWASTYYPK